MVAFFNIKVKKRPAQKTAIDKTPIKMTMQKPPKGQTGIITMQEKGKDAAKRKPLFTITSKDPAQKAVAKPTVTVKTESGAETPKQPATQAPPAAAKETPPAPKPKPLETADLHALAEAMGVKMEPEVIRKEPDTQRVVPAPKRNDLIVEKPTPVKKRTTPKTKHDKVVEALAKSFDRSVARQPRKKKPAKKTLNTSTKAKKRQR